MLVLNMALLPFGMSNMHNLYVYLLHNIDALKAHNDCITRVIWLEEDQTLLTASKDKTIKVLYLHNLIGMETT